MVPRSSKLLYLAFIALCGLLMLGSCSRRSVTPDEPGGDPMPWDDSPVVMLHISTFNAGYSASAAVTERIRSLRIIMIHEAGGQKYIEANRWIDVGTVGINFNYIFQKRTVVGKKSFYLIANEESMPQVTINDPVSPIGGTQNITTFLNYFEPDMPTADSEGGKDATGRPSAEEFEQMLNSLSFTPEPYKIVGSDIYLPYSAYYTDFVIGEDDHIKDYTDQPMYLVPVATKFKFKIISERSAEVAIDYLALHSTNQTNYLMAQLDEEDLYKRTGGEDLWWIDWLKLAGDETQAAENTGSNANVNDKYGWIRGYRVPNEDTNMYDFVRDKWIEDEEYFTPAKLKESYVSGELRPWIIPQATMKDGKEVPCDPQEYGPYYLPEGKNMVTETYEEVDPDAKPDDPETKPETPETKPEEGGGSGESTTTPGTDGEDTGDTGGSGDGTDTGGTGSDQQGGTITKTEEKEKYILKLRMRDTSKAEDIEEDNRSFVKTAETEISNLKSLFRNTSVLITIMLREGGVNIYAEDVPWEPKRFNGYVQDEDDI